MCAVHLHRAIKWKTQRMQASLVDAPDDDDHRGTGDLGKANLRGEARKLLPAEMHDLRVTVRLLCSMTVR